MTRTQALAPAVWLTLFLQTACAGRSGPPATTLCTISVDPRGQLDLASLPALSADGARVAVPERCDDRHGPPCLAITLLSVDGTVRERVEVAQRSVIEAPQIRRVNQLLADGRFARMTSLDLPFSAGDLNVMTVEVSGVVIHYSEGTLHVDRDDHRLARLDLPPIRDCTGPWIRSLFLDDKTHTLAVEFEYHDQTGCSAPPPAWRVVRFI